MDKIKECFEKRFSKLGINLPIEEYEKRENGSIQLKGWIIKYCFGIENEKEYMDYYANHRMTDPDHSRIYDDGTKVYLNNVRIGFKIVPDDPEQTKRNEDEMFEHNRKVGEELIKKRIYIIWVIYLLSFWVQLVLSLLLYG